MMNEPRESAQIIDELHDLNQLINSTKQLIVKYPGDKLMALTLRADEYRRELLLKELHQSLSLYLQPAE